MVSSWISADLFLRGLPVGFRVVGGHDGAQTGHAINSADAPFRRIRFQAFSDQQVRVREAFAHRNERPTW